ncbi:hypothetical protein TcWFU_010044 [Taenia crassiceps]|uniref:Uncharacterized protein n=1 Tax=Taenia crassiceps TaxID=6207 RepID=A0ABR4Q4N8_9CEST
MVGLRALHRGSGCDQVPPLAQLDQRPPSTLLNNFSHMKVGHRAQVTASRLLNENRIASARSKALSLLWMTELTSQWDKDEDEDEDAEEKQKGDTMAWEYNA